MGLNTKYQLGFKDKLTRHYPTRIEVDSNGKTFGNISKVGCTYFATFALSTKG